MKQNELRRLYRRCRVRWKESPLTATRRGADKLWAYSYSPIAKIRHKNDSFNFLGANYPYFIHHYNPTWRNERAVEISLALEFLSGREGSRVLELGNVMEYYSPVDHDVVDKYENTPGIRNIDFVDFSPDIPYDAFVSVSTVEHIGWDELPRQPEKVHEALKKIPTLVNNPDNVFVTFPLGYNSYLDDLARRGELGFKHSGSLVRINSRNDWCEAPLVQALEATYGSRYPGANALFVGIGLET